MSDRAQAVTLEALVAALLLLGVLVFALQTASVTPSGASTTNAHLENQHERLAAGALDSAAANNSLKPTLGYWNETNASFHGVHQKGFYPNDGPPTALGALLDRTLADQGLAYNVNLHYMSRDGHLRQQPLVYVGSPSANAVTASRLVLLTDDDHLYDPSGTVTETTLSETSSYFAPDAAPQSHTYNVVRVEVVVWRT